MLNYQKWHAILLKVWIAQKKKQVGKKFPQNVLALQSDFFPSSEITSSQQHGTYFQLQQHWFILWRFRHWQENINYSFCCSVLQLFYMWFIPVKRAQCSNCIADVFNLQVGWTREMCFKVFSLVNRKSTSWRIFFIFSRWSKQML